MNMTEGGVSALRLEVVAGQTIVVFGWQGRNNHIVGGEPRVVVQRRAIGFQVVHPDRKLVGQANAPAVGGGNALLVHVSAVVVSVVHHGVDAQCGVVAGLDVEVAGQARFFARTDRQVDLMLVHQEGLLADLVDHTTC